MTPLDEAYIREDGGGFLHIMSRLPFDAYQPIRGFRLHVNDSDIVAGINIEFESCAEFVDLFDEKHRGPYRQEWCSPDGEWRILIDCDELGKRIVTSEVTSQILHRPWFVRTSLEIETKNFPKIADDVRRFIGTYE